MICVDFYYDVALFDTIQWVFDLLASVLFVFSQKHEAFTVPSRRDKHHFDHIFIVKLFMVRNLTHDKILPIRIVVLNEIINQVSLRRNLVIAVARRRKVIIISIQIDDS